MKIGMQHRPRTGLRFGVLLTLAVMLAGCAGLLTYRWLRAAVPSAEILIARRDIRPWERVTAADFTLQARPTSAVPADALRDPAVLSGLVSRGQILAGDLVRPGHFAQAQGSSLSMALAQTPEMRVIALTPEQLEGLGALLTPGDRVDVLGVMSIQNGQVNEHRIGVLAAGATVVQVAAPTSGGIGGSTGSTILVSMLPDEAAKTKLAQATGKVYVQLTVGQGELPPVMTPAAALSPQVGG